MILNTTLTLVICVLEAVRGIPKFYEGRVTTREQLWRKGLRIFSPYRADDASSSHNLNFVTAKCTDINQGKMVPECQLSENSILVASCCCCIFGFTICVFVLPCVHVSSDIANVRAKIKFLVQATMQVETHPCSSSIFITSTQKQTKKY